MHEGLKARLAAATRDGEVLGIIYRGGSCPGAYRRIMPIKLDGDQVRARCYTSNAVKVFALAKIELSDSTAPPEPSVAPAWSPPPLPPVPAFANIAEIVSRYRAPLEALGWHVEHESTEDGDELRLCGRLKNGKPKRTATISLAYETMTYDFGVTLDGGVERINLRRRARPWIVRTPQKTSTWAHVDGAVRTMIEAAGIVEEAAVAQGVA